jgi:hypothetical protein
MKSCQKREQQYIKREDRILYLIYYFLTGVLDIFNEIIFKVEKERGKFPSRSYLVCFLFLPVKNISSFLKG